MVKEISEKAWLEGPCVVYEVELVWGEMKVYIVNKWTECNVEILYGLESGPERQVGWWAHEFTLASFRGMGVYCRSSLGATGS